jgi:hypothetical protein
MATRPEAPDFTAFHRSISEELYSVKDRIRSLVKHWGTDGEYKELALRSVLRRHLPGSVTVGRGFIVTPRQSSTQIDILVVDASKPTLFKDGDLLIVTPDAVRAIIEVKTVLRTRPAVAQALTKLSEAEDLCREATGHNSAWTGLFIFGGDDDSAPRLLGGLADARAATGRQVNCISCGPNQFVRFWDRGRDVGSRERGAVWHAYDLPGVAPSYFLGNLIDALGSVEDSTAGFAWFPMLGGKEQHRSHYLPLAESEPRSF